METLRQETDEAGPSIGSENPDERIAARRLRIAARNEAKKRQELGSNSQEDTEIKEVRMSQKKVEQSEKRMAKLQADGTELVTNILVAADFRESKRRAEMEEARRLRIEKLENEAKSSLEKFEEITQKWTVAKAKQIPQDLRDALISQQILCGQLLEDKNKVIIELQQELKASDDRYVKDLKKHTEEVDLMIERLQEQIISLKKSYREELDLVESTFDEERRTLLADNRMKWEQQRQRQSDRELELLLQRMQQVEEHELQLQRLRLDNTKECNTIKAKLEMDVQILEQQLQKMKATCQLNQEKLEYNFQVLKKRDEENIITKSQQKRKITRMQDILNNLKTKCSNQEKQSREENQSLTDDYKRIMQQYKDMQRKMRHFAAVDAKRLEDVWLMNEAEAKALVRQALEIDRLIHEQQLGLAWTPPPLTVMEQPGPVQPRNRIQPSARQAAAQALVRREAPGEERELEEQTDGNTVEVPGGPESTGGRMDQKTVKRLLELLCDEMGFLIESKLLKLLSPLEKDERSLIKLDSIFSALAIESEEDVYKMADFFMKYKFQQKDQAEHSSVSNQGETAEQKDSDLIHPNDVLRALRTFTALYCKPRDISSRQLSGIPELEGRDDSEDGACWESLATVVPEPKLKVWSTLEAALEKYHFVLTERSKLVNETQHLKQQNSELRMLLHQYLNSKVNTELAIPPTQVMKLDPE
ncbi:dynein regulatory complex protein 1 isoform X2 [Electrophorus electricus]|uniref:dynein regulatory complex protein 1 isoform X2 n=1 Tax=Electrophorus electricus TaxID=8005 RepID=UPI0015D0B3E9|nr:dynein regulatory complex protein 1 isoform X2 [Electrophorus electricus]